MNDPNESRTAALSTQRKREHDENVFLKCALESISWRQIAMKYEGRIVVAIVDDAHQRPSVARMLSGIGWDGRSLVFPLAPHHENWAHSVRQRAAVASMSEADVDAALGAGCRIRYEPWIRDYLTARFAIFSRRRPVLVTIHPPRAIFSDDAFH